MPKLESKDEGGGVDPRGNNAKNAPLTGEHLVVRVVRALLCRFRVEDALVNVRL